jgi:hypothetical protein
MKDLHNNVMTPYARHLPRRGGHDRHRQDRQGDRPAGYGGVEFIVGYGTITATNAVFTAVMKEGDVTGTMTSVADADMLGTELLAAWPRRRRAPAA